MGTRAPRTAGAVGIRGAGVLAGWLVAGVLALTACGGGGTGDDAGATASPSAPPSAAGPATARVDPAVQPYCDAVTRAQAEMTAPGAGLGGVATASEAARRQVDELARTAPPEVAGDWRALQGLTEQALTALGETGGDPNRIDRELLTRLEQESRPAVERIKQVTAARCGVEFLPPA